MQLQIAVFLAKDASPVCKGDSLPSMVRTEDKVAVDRLGSTSPIVGKSVQWIFVDQRAQDRGLYSHALRHDSRELQ